MSKAKKFFDENLNQYDDKVFADDYDFSTDPSELDDLVKIADETNDNDYNTDRDIRELDELLNVSDQEDMNELDELLEEAVQTSFYFDSPQFPRDEHPQLYKFLDTHGDEIYQAILDDKELQILYHTDHSILAKHFENELKQLCKTTNIGVLKTHLAELGIHNIDDKTIKQIRAENTACGAKAKKKQHIGLFEHQTPNDNHQILGHHAGAKKRR
jgi:hypothetical protein